MKKDEARQKQLSKLNRKAKGILLKMAAGIYRKLIRYVLVIDVWMNTVTLNIQRQLK